MNLGVNIYRFTVIYNSYVTKKIQHQYHIVQISILQGTSTQNLNYLY